MLDYSGYVIYLDVLLALNFALDFVLLWAAGRLLHRRGSLARLLASAAVGAVYGAALVFPALALLYRPPAAVLVSLLLLLIAYRFRSAADFLRLAGVFYLIAFAMAGGVLAALRILQESALSFSGEQLMQTGALLAALPVALIVGGRGYAAWRRSVRREDYRARLCLTAAGRSVTLPVLIDTGCDLREPLSQRPVAVADYRAVLTLLPERVRAAYAQQGERPAEILRTLAAQTDGDGWLRRLLLVPFDSVGQSHGLLLAFRPDTATLLYQGRAQCVSLIVAISPHGVGRGSGFAAVVNPDVFEQTKEAKSA